ncbi:MAG: hypothetical protein FVQ84_08525 [Planctomycetes bacterium]|nr:hypothetical protein [Planctomycetota bacterium]
MALTKSQIHLANDLEVLKRGTIVCATGATGPTGPPGTSVAIETDGTPQSTAVTVLNFITDDFALIESPADDFQVSLAAEIPHTDFAETIGGAWTFNAVATFDAGIKHATKLDFFIGSTVEMELSLNRLLFNNGAVDTSLSWSVSGKLDFLVGGGLEIEVRSNSLTFVPSGTRPRLEWGTSATLNIQSGSTTRIGINTTGMGFFAVAPVARPTVTGSRGGNAALADLLVELENLGLIIDSSS